MEAKESQVRRIASFDIDGVINMGDYPGVRPAPGDVIISGRSAIDEYRETALFLQSIHVWNEVHLQQCRFEEKTRLSSGWHKAQTINKLNEQDHQKIVIHYEDDPVQAQVIRDNCKGVQVVLLQHDLVEKENVRHEFN